MAKKAKKSNFEYKRLLLSMLLSFSAAIIGSIFTFREIPTWYAGLVKTPISPPNWLFGPMWTVLYFLIGLSFYYIWVKGFKTYQSKLVLALYIIQLVLNAAWSIVFFGLHSLIGGAILIVFLWFSIVGNIVEAREVSKTAAYLLLPYLAWVTIATILNISVLWFNA